MGWWSNKKDIKKINPLNLGKRQQEDFLKSGLKLSPQRIAEIKNKSQGQLLKLGKNIKASKFHKLLQQQGIDSKAEWNQYVKTKAQEVAKEQDKIRQENIKKVRMMDRKKQAADNMINKLIGRSDPEQWRKKALNRRVVERTSTEPGLSAKESRILKAQTELIERKKTSWQHAESNYDHSVQQSLNKKDKNRDQDDKNNSDQEIEEAQEQAKNLPDLQI